VAKAGGSLMPGRITSSVSFVPHRNTLDLIWIKQLIDGQDSLT
jgi:hypothetical protein